MAGDPRAGSWLAATWDAPAWIRAGITLRAGGHSRPPFDSLNLATHVGDEEAAVIRNRQHVSSLLQVDAEPLWLNQVHGHRILCAESADDFTADGTYTDRPGVICTVMTADCVPVLLCNRAGTRVAAVHVGWRGFCSAILDNALQLFRDDFPGTLVWIGPHIRSPHYEVGDDVRSACLDKDSRFISAFTANTRGRWQADLEQMIRLDLAKYGVHHIAGTPHCTYAEPDLFYSYRRDGQTGRMASMIWMVEPDRVITASA